MKGTRVTVRCRDCTFTTTHDKLRDARSTLADHEAATGHSVEWIIKSIDAGVAQAGADAGVCGHAERVNEDSPLVDPKPAKPDS